MSNGAFISGCAGTELTADEIRFFADTRPWGLILFARNVDHPAQILSLTKAFREAVEDAHAPVLIDQEGGRVQRMRPPNWQKYLAPRRFSDLEKIRRGAGQRAAFLTGRLIAEDLYQAGISIDCVPVLDVPVAGVTEAIGDRTFGDNADQVILLAGEAVTGFLGGGIAPVIKHMPGHGRATVDSHVDLPRVTATLDELNERDFAAFRPFSHLPMGMTAHVVIEALDISNPATLSPTVIETAIRDEIGFDGLLMTDDISMGALQMPLGERCSRALNAGCDLVLHCNGELDEMKIVADACGRIEPGANFRSDTARLFAPSREEADIAELRSELAALTLELGDRHHE